MAGLGTGVSPRGRRELNHDLALVPFIDFLLCLVAFLLVTAVWSQHARLKADALVPGRLGEVSRTPPAELHVSVTDQEFLLKWQQGGTVLSSTQIAKQPLTLPDGSLRYPDLAAAAVNEWKARGSHRAASDALQDRAVLHTPNSLEFREVTAVLDALHGPKRTFATGRASAEIPTFAVAFATD